MITRYSAHQHMAVPFQYVQKIGSILQPSHWFKTLINDVAAHPLLTNTLGAELLMNCGWLDKHFVIT